MPGKKKCFVVMGFGKKTDYGSKKPRTLDLDRTYKAIIKPAVTQAGLECIRADEIRQSGMIDRPMYEMLLGADLVIADISTANPNALYELGVRHALRPFSTIIIKEIDGTFMFDLNHLATFQYKHLGEDIGSAEAEEKRTQLQGLIQQVLSQSSMDSPVYTFLTGLTGPKLTPSSLEHAVAEIQVQPDSMAQVLERARQAAKEGDSETARDCFQQAHDLQTRPVAGDPQLRVQADPYLVQQLALHTYQAQKPSELDALRKADEILQQLEPASSTDPETLGICGAIQKRLYKQTQDRANLDMAIEMYERGFVLKQDYYNGENYALCLNWRADQQAEPEDAAYDRRTAQKTRERVIAGLTLALNDAHAAQRPDFMWMLATMANTLRALGVDPASYEAQFRVLVKEPKHLATFEQGKRYAMQIAASAPQIATTVVKHLQDAATEAQKAVAGAMAQLGF